MLQQCVNDGVNHEVFFHCILIFSLSKNLLKIVANLPYQISSSLILRLIPFRHESISVTVMVQQEVAERLCAKRENRKTGRLQNAKDGRTGR